MSDDWKILLKGGFCGMGASFSSHQNDEERAIKMITLAKRDGIKFHELMKEAEDHLSSQNAIEPRKQTLLTEFREFCSKHY